MSLLAPARPRAVVPARRALVRWSWRMLRREWRSQALVTVLLTVTVGVAVCGGSLIDNAPPPVDQKLGTADTQLTLDGKNPQAVAADLATIRARRGTAEVIGHTPERAPGSANTIDYRSQTPHGPFAGKLLAIRQGRYPSGPAEAAVTGGVAQLLGLRLGGTISLDGHTRTIVGIAENPADLGDQFVLVDPASIQPPSLAVLIKGQPAGNLRLTTASPAAMGAGTNNDAIVITTLVLGGTTILLLLVAFVAAAAFAVLAHRRLRQLGMLAAIGATDRQVRLVMTATGLLVGALSAALGAVAGLGLWPLVAPRLESPFGHRIAVSNVPWPLIAVILALSVLTSTVAAWWPARAVSRVPVTLALSQRPPVRVAGRRSVLVAAGLFAAGIGLLAWGGKKHPWPIAGGTVATALAVLFAAPTAVKLLAAAGSRAPIAVRLALRDLARHQARSAAAVAAVSLALGIPAALIIITTGAQSTPKTGNLGDRQLVVLLGSADTANLVPVKSADELAAITTQVNRIAAGLSHATVIPLDKPISPDIPAPGGAGGPARPTAGVGIPLSEHESEDVDSYVATPELYRLIGVDPARISASADIVTTRTSDLVLQGRRDNSKPVITRVHGPAYTSMPTTLITPDALARRGWTRIRAAWFIQSDKPLTGRQKADARRIAAAAGVTVETRDGQGALSDTRFVATAVGGLFALGILAMAVGLIRSEAADDLRTLTATGATRTIRRTLAATTAGAMALLGVVLGVAGAGLGLLAVYRHDLGVFGRVPIGYPIGLLAGVPLLAMVAGWLLAGREPRSIARRLGE